MLRGTDIGRLAKLQLAQATGLQPVTVSGVTKEDGQGWRASVDMIELKRLPDATDVLATYEAVLDDDGNLLSYQRLRRYLRGQVAVENGP
jgi:hypothetical protein